MNLTAAIRRAAQRSPHDVVTVFGARRRTAWQFLSRVSRLAGGWHALGVREGDRVAMLSHNSDRFLEYYPSTYWAGAVVEPLNTRWSEAELAFALEDCKPRVLLVDAAHADQGAALVRRCGWVRALVFADDGPAPAGMHAYEDLIADNAPVPDALRGGDDLAGVYYTGGTTGRPKGVMLSHRNIFANSIAVLAERGFSQDCIGLHAAPMFHLADGCFMNAMFEGGGRHVVVPRFDPAAVVDAIEREGVTDALLVPTMIQALLDSPAFSASRLNGLRNLVYGASPIGEAALDRLAVSLPSTGLTQMYGMTELSPVATVLRPEHHRGAFRQRGVHRSAGRAAIGCEVLVVDQSGAEASRGTVGEVRVRGPGVMLGYWGQPGETAEAVHEGWMLTGDLGFMDESGFLFLVDRKKDMIVTGGENVYSADVERALSTHPDVATAAVIGVPSERWGEEVLAFVVPRPDTAPTPESLMAHCRAAIAAYKCPRRVELVESLPLSGAGKVLKHALRERFWKDARRHVN